MAIKVQKFVIDEAVLDIIGNEFKFDHSKGLAEWLKNSSDAYLREHVPDDEQFMIIRLTEDSRGQLVRIECIDFVGMNKKHIDDAFKRFFDPQAAKKGAKDAQIKTLGGHGNGGKFYMRQMFKSSQAISFRDGKLNIFGFNAKRQYGFEEGFEDRRMSLQAAMVKADIDKIVLADDVRAGLSSGEFGFTVVRGENPHKVKATTNRGKLVEKLVFHPQARRLIDRKPVTILFGNETKPTRLTAPNLVPKEGFEQAVVIQIPASLEWEGKAVPFKTESYDWPGRLVLKTSNDPLRGNLATLNTIDFLGEVGVIATYRIHEFGATRFSGQSEFIYGECECWVLEDPDNDCVRNDRQKLLETERSLSLIEWVRDQVEELAEKMEVKNVQEKKKRDLKNTSAFNEMLNRWKNRFMGQMWAEVFVGKGPAGSAGGEPGGGPSGTGDGGDGGTGSGAGSGHEGGSETKRKPRFPRVLISSEDNDPLDPLSSEPFHCDRRHPAIYRRPKDVDAGIYWINTSRPLADKIIKEYTSDSTRWREYLFQRYVDIIIKESIYQLGKIETSLSPEDVDRCIDNVTTRIHDHAATDLNAFLFEEQFGLN